jgi:hypothetical protein
MSAPKKTMKLKLVPRDGSIDAVPYEEPEEPEAEPAEDGKYYLSGSTKSALLAWELYERGIAVYCAKCKSQLKMSRAFIFCPTDRKHFDIIT